jgi:ABC-2 type transport system permease protein
MQFRADFAVGLVSSLLYSALSVVLQFLLFSLTRGYPGWRVEDMILFQGMFLVWSGLRETLFGGVRDFIMRIMWKGDFDRVLLKPFHSGGLLLVSGFDFQRIGSAAAGIVVIVLAFPATGSVVTVWGLLAFFALLAAGVVLYLAMTLLFCALTVTIVNSGRFGELMDRMMDFSAYPSELFPKVARTVYEVGLPFAVFICFPTRALLGRLDLVMAGGAAAAVAFFLASLAVWNVTMKRYTSAGG